MRLIRRATLQLLLLLSLLHTSQISARVGTWGDLLSYTTSVGFAYNDTECLHYSRSAILRYNFVTGERTRYSKLHKLTDAQIQTAALSPSGEIWVSYLSGRVDYLASDERRTTYSDLESQVSSGLRTPIRYFTALDDSNAIGISPEYLYLFTNGRLVTEYRIWAKNRTHALQLNAVQRIGTTLYVATSSGIYKAPLNALPSLQFQQEEKPLGNITALATNGSKIVALRQLSLGYELWYTDIKTPWKLITTRLNQFTGKLTLTPTDEIFLIENTGQILTTSLTGNEQLYHDDTGKSPEKQYRAQALYRTSDGITYVSSRHRGLLRIATKSTTAEVLSPASPAFTSCNRVQVVGSGKVVLANGYSGDKAHFEAGEALLYFRRNDEEGYNIHWNKPCKITDLALLDASRERYAVATDTEGLLIFEGGELREHYTSDNSILTKGTGTAKSAYIHALNAAPEGDLYILVGRTAELFRLTADKQWSVEKLTHNYSRHSITLVRSPNGNLFLGSRSISELIAIQPNTFFSTNGKEGLHAQYLNDERLRRGSLTNSIDFTENEIWIGSHLGLIHASNPEQLLTGKNLLFNAPTLYLPSKEQAILFEDTEIGALATDSGGRIWASSPNKGVFWVDPARRLLLGEYQTHNSPLPSNQILDIRYNPEDGLVYIATEGGVLSYVSSALEASRDYSNVRIYPNPVRPDFTGELCIDGLMDKSYLKIVDSGGELVRELESNGGRATWDFRNGAGNRVASGVYLVFLSNESSGKSFVGKFVVVR